MLKLASVIFWLSVNCWGQSPPLESRDLQVHVVHSSGLQGAARRVELQHRELGEWVEARTGLRLPKQIEVHLTASHDDFNRAIQRLGGAERPQHVAAVAFPYKDVIVMKTTAWIQNHGGFAELYKHELTHCAIGALRQKQPVDIPRWFEEGLAQFVAQSTFFGPSDVLERAIAEGNTIALARLEEVFPDQEGASALAYAQSLSLVQFLHEYQTKQPDSRRRLSAMLRQLARGDSFEGALHLATGLEVAELEAAWLGKMKVKSTLSMRQMPSLVFGSFLLIVTLLLFARHRVKRARLLDALLSEESEAD